ncbi:MAG: hypothetical protein EXR66_04810 [Dehalococcoidia bacterium]|nr:hypothetical protein [Dehalococcoidia bacterium]
MSHGYEADHRTGTAKTGRLDVKEKQVFEHRVLRFRARREQPESRGGGVAQRRKRLTAYLVGIEVEVLFAVREPASGRFTSERAFPGFRRRTLVEARAGLERRAWGR